MMSTTLLIVVHVHACVELQVLSRTGSLTQQHHFVDVLGLNVEGSQYEEGVVRGSETNCVRLRGLPYEATAEDVINFFGEEGANIANKGVHMELNSMVCVSI